MLSYSSRGRLLFLPRESLTQLTTLHRATHPTHKGGFTIGVPGIVTNVVSSARTIMVPCGVAATLVLTTAKHNNVALGTLVERNWVYVEEERRHAFVEQETRVDRSDGGGNGHNETSSALALDEQRWRRDRELSIGWEDDER
ncbi:uncharacterized protein HKW66_Vig0115430 [Vigna angularis]|uniref:Uncharacterized protein n=1 Tax=Phaseolus angularis TaxID=3914 RepID=A0A8T0KZ34_PHAAN|nr:uncharacterized protein HKW66_Vig0115430 [Vigna angularis]